MNEKKLKSVWHNMKTRCGNKNSNVYKWYGSRGIHVCDEWLDYQNFRVWALSAGYDDSLTLDRIDTNGDYCPENCRFISQKKNCNNRRSNHLIEHRGAIHTLREWSDSTGINYETLCSRIHELGWSFEKAITTPIHKIKNKENTMAELARMCGLEPDTVRKRIKRYGWSVEEALSVPAGTMTRRRMAGVV